jgi:hypothetical protein
MATLESIKSAKDKYGSDFYRWLEEVLVFAVEPSKTSAKDLIKEYPYWREVLETAEGLERYKTNSPEVLKYSLKKYVYFNCKECSNPKLLTNLNQLNIDTVVDALNLNFFDQETPSNVLEGLIEGLDAACRSLAPSLGSLDISEILMNFWGLYFSNNDYQDLLNFGDPKQNFNKLHQKMTGQTPIQRKDGILILAKSFYEKLTTSERSLVKSKLENGERPKKEDYSDVMEALRSYAYKYK